MRFTVTINYADGGSVELRIPPASILAYEEEHQQTIEEAKASGRLRWFPWVVWHALTIRRNEKRPFLDWFEAVEDLEDTSPAPDDEADGADPTGAAPDPGSANSPESSPGPGSGETSS